VPVSHRDAARVRHDCTYFRLPFQSFTMTGDNGWLDEVSSIDRTRTPSTSTHRRRQESIATGDWVELESAANGQTVRGKARLTEALHPDVVMVRAMAPLAKGLPWQASRQGINFNRLLKQDFEHMDTLSLNLDLL